MASPSHVLFGELEEPVATVTAADILNEQEQLEQEAEEQLNGNWGDEDACTHADGYRRQPVFACATCTKAKGGAPFGFCFGCSLNCHVDDDHDIIELFDKRHFRCDCGTPRSGCSCRFHPDGHAQDNTENVYSHNFGGKYCWCDAAYSEEQTMYQCVLCMDWFHLDCISKRDGWALDPDTPSDFVCGTCVQLHPFLKGYASLAITHAAASGAPPTDSTAGESPVDVTTAAAEGCKLAGVDAADASRPDGSAQEKSVFFRKQWRAELCRCAECLERYRSQQVGFLAEDEDDISDNEPEPDEVADDGPAATPGSGALPDGAQPTGTKRKSTSLLDAAQNAFIGSGIPATQQIDLMDAYNNMQAALKDFLKTFSETGKEVTKADIDAFFADFKSKRSRYQ
eukprot:TRINITY_DN7037_c0_g1_i1.p1 TRINITY_DN7037_c0_g1~~TRINITY_DN7037_c0_g1_i1.p1  ORF type:complete len:397 (-),score=128.09 TRINITY_DN7037_c0_g1_i1:14-1204(-)